MHDNSDDDCESRNSSNSTNSTIADPTINCNIMNHTCEAEDECCTEESFLFDDTRVKRYSCMKFGE